MGDPKEERKFLHDIASPVTSLLLNLESLQSLLDEEGGLDRELARQLLETCTRQVKRVSGMIDGRRNVLIAEMEGQ